MLGTTLVPALRAQGHVVLRHGFASMADINVDLIDAYQTATMIEQVRPDAVVNLVALTDVDICETSPDRAYRLNVLSIQNLCRAIKQSHPACHLVQVSTDMVYDGDGPHEEQHVTVRNTYTLSKLAAELAAAQINSTVLRTNFFGRSQRAGYFSFSDWLYNSLRMQTPIKIFDDVLFSPLSIGTLCAMIGLVVEKRPLGVYNLGAHDGLTKADFAFAFAARLNLPAGNMQRFRVDAMDTLKAKRPKDMRMDSSQFEQALHVRLPTLLDEINLIGDDYRD